MRVTCGVLDQVYISHATSWGTTSMNPTLAWERVGERFFRLSEGPALQWDIEVAHKHIRGAPHGGVIAVWDREDIIIRQEPGAAIARQRPRMNLYNAQGTVIGHVPLDFGSVVDVLLPLNETIIVVSGSGLCRHYTDFGQNFVQIHLPGSPLKAELNGDGYVVQLDMEDGLSMVFVSNYASAEPKMRTVSLEASESYELWSVLPANELYGQSEQIVAVTAQGEVHVYDFELSQNSRKVAARNVPVGSMVGSMAISTDCRFIAFSNGQDIKVFGTDFHAQIFEGLAKAHTSVHWVGNNSLGLETGPGEIEVLVLNETADSGTIYFDDDEALFIAEIDGLRALGSKSHTLLLPVSKSTADTFKLGSTAPSAILLSCIDYLDVGSPRAEQTVKLLDSVALARAVDVCISAALEEVDAKLQRRLMRAAAFGKSVLEVYDSTRYLEALTKLRIGNSLRDISQHPLFITNLQLSSLGFAPLIRRLELRQLWPTAVAIAKLENIPVEPVYIEWSCWYIQSHSEASDDELLSGLNQKLSKLNAYSHSKMARRALEQGRQKLALSLLEKEPVATDRVLIMIEMEMVQQALEQAMKSGNPYLVDYVLLVISEHLTLSQLMSNVGWNAPVVERYSRLLELPPHTKDSLHQFLTQVDKRAESLHIEFNEVVEETDYTHQLQGLHALERKYTNTSKKFYNESRVTSSWANLLEKQKGLEAAFSGTSFIGLSAAETIVALLKIPQEKTAEQMRSKLGLSDRQFWWLRVGVLRERRDWSGLWDLSHKQRPPIGFRPFFDAAFEAGNLEAAAKYVELISDASNEEKVKLLLKCKETNKARDLATRTRDQALVALVQGEGD